jgi:DNA repair exonuclease SbcCD ATPase subunit
MRWSWRLITPNERKHNVSVAMNLVYGAANLVQRIGLFLKNVGEKLYNASHTPWHWRWGDEAVPSIESLEKEVEQLSEKAKDLEKQEELSRFMLQNLRSNRHELEEQLKELPSSYASHSIVEKEIESIESQIKERIKQINDIKDERNIIDKEFSKKEKQLDMLSKIDTTR